MEQLAVYGGLSLSAFLAATLLPASSEAVLAGLVSTGAGDPVALLAVATAANTGGSTVNWLLGRLVSRWRHLRWFPIAPERYERAQRWFERFGEWSLLFAWLPFVGDPLTVAAGTLRIKFARFLVLVALGKAARYAVIVAGSLWCSGS